MNAAQKGFVEDMGQAMVGWGVPRTTGRIYGYLLLQAGPVSLDELSAELSVAKSGASVATRQLRGFGLARASGEAGSRRIRYAALYDLDAIIAARMTQTRDLISHLGRGARVATMPHAKRHLAEMATSVETALQRVPQLVGRAQKRSTQ